MTARGHSPILYDTALLFVYTDELFALLHFHLL